MSGLTVETKCGLVKGFEENGMNKWYGIPFAKPPVGPLRFKRSVPCDPWDGVKDATHFGNRPIQFGDIGGSGKGLNTVPESEDCLYLNIWAPKAAEKLPVFVWIYGGANTIGEGSDPGYFGDAFARDGVIYVNFNYRVGPLGFYNFALYDSSFDSNCAVSDMISGLKWVKENIEAFGGDSNNITIAGESAGGTAVYSMLSAPKAKGLFNKAIAQSGLAGNVSKDQVQILNIDLFLDQLKLSREDVHKLKDMDIETMRPAAEYVYSKNCTIYPGLYVAGPVVDDLIPEQPWEAMDHGSAEGVDVIFGSCHDEGSLFYMLKMFPTSWEATKKMLEISGIPEKLEELQKLYAGLSEKRAMKCLGTDMAFWKDHIKCTQAQAQAGKGKVYCYRFDFTTLLLKLAGMGAMHGSDIGPALDTYEGGLSKITRFSSKKRNEKIHSMMHGAWVSFAKTGDPNGSHLPIKWNEYNIDTKETFIFNDTCSTENAPKTEAFNVWKDINVYAK